ncbi:MAG: tetratricopeptide repeat protein, partial [Nitrospinae bacterium]|nr:tetratricopeptide repeat protein [Nitrospinota bacterium]
MNAGKLAYYTLLAAAAAVGFHLGQRQVEAAPARMEDVALSELEGRTRLTVTLDEGAPLKLFFDRENRKLTLRFTGTTIPPYLADLAYQDKLVESVKTLGGTGVTDATLEVLFRTDAVAFTRGGPADARTVTFEFRSGATPIRLPGKMTLAQFEEKLNPPAVAEATPEPTAEPLADSADAMIASTPAEPAPPAATAPDAPSAEVIARRFAPIDAVYNDKEARSGRDVYLALMKQMRKEEEEALKTTIGQAQDFLKTYRDSVYRETVAYTLANAAFLLSKRNKEYRDQAMDAYNEAMSAFPQSVYYPQAMMRRANIYWDKDFGIEALTELGGLIRNFPTNKYVVPAMLARADIYLTQRKYQRAHNELEQILVLYPTRPEVRDVKYMIAESYYDRGEYSQAMSIFDDALTRWPTYPKTHPRTYLKIADTRYQLGLKEVAADDFLSLANLFPQLEEGRRALLRLGDLYVEQQRIKEGLSLYEELIRVYPKNDEAVMATLRMASLGAENPDLLKASRIFEYDAYADPLAAFDEVVKKFPEKFGEEALKRKGRALTGMKRYLTAILTLKDLLKSYPATRLSEEVFGQVRENLVRLIETYHGQEGFFLALLTYYENFDPFLRSLTDPVTLARIADSYDAMTLYDRAVDYYRMAARYDTGQTQLPRNAYRIARATLAKGAHDEAAKMLERYLTQFPATPYTNPARHLLGQALYRGGDPTRAATEWRMAIESDPMSPLTPESAYLLGGLY